MGTFNPGIPMMLRNIQPPPLPLTRIIIYKTINGVSGDNTAFQVSITKNGIPYVISASVRPLSPFVVSNIGYGTFVVTEVANALYTQDSIAPSTFVISADNPQQIVQIVNSLIEVPSTGSITINKIITTKPLRTVIYGNLYNWYAATDIRGIAPAGWHVPSIEEFATLETYLGGSSISGGKLKESGYTHWSIDNIADNLSGFSAYGGGGRDYDGTFAPFNRAVYFWSTTENGSDGRYLILNESIISYSQYGNQKSAGCYIRLIKDSSLWVEGETVTDYDSNVYNTILIGTQVWMLSSLIVQHFNNGDIIPNVSNNATWSDLLTAGMCYYGNLQSNAFTFESEVITDATYFHVKITGQRAIDPVEVEGDVSQSDSLYFPELPFDTYVIEETLEDGYTLLSIDDNPVVVDAGHTYVRVEITNEVVQGLGYGALYNWYAASKNGGTGVGSIAPIGWHVPTRADKNILFSTLGGYLIGGGKLKQTGTEYWRTPNVGATNEFGFNGLASGVRRIITGYSEKLQKLIFWITETSDETHGESIWLQYQNAELAWAQWVKKDGASIRLLKDDSVNSNFMTDIDGNVYPTVKIGNQVWMAANLAVTKFNDGTLIPNVTDNSEWAALTTGAMCYYDNNILNA